MTRREFLDGLRTALGTDLSGSVIQIIITDISVTKSGRDVRRRMSSQSLVIHG